ncbi:MAG: flagellar hook capping FlgD N-terminal domain-containing protein [Fuerstiella sp.]
MPEAFSGALGTDQFLNLFVTQLQYQDPLSPMDQTDSLAQLAQFSQLESSNNLNSKFDQLLDLEIQSHGNQLATVGAGMLGREVSFGNSQSGVADGVSRVDGQILVSVGGQLIPISDVNGIAVAGT